jgi:hypothetical protein
MNTQENTREMIIKLRENMIQQQNAINSLKNSVDSQIQILSDFISEPIQKPKSEPIQKPKRIQPSFYRNWLANEMQKIKKEQPSLSKNEYMSIIAHRWAEYKKTSKFNADKAAYNKSIISGGKKKYKKSS